MHRVIYAANVKTFLGSNPPPSDNKGYRMAKLVASTEGKIDWDSIVQKCRDSTDGDFNSVGTVVDRSESSFLEQYFLSYSH